MTSKRCKVDYEKKDLKPDFTVTSYIDYLDNKGRDSVQPQHLELAEYYFDHYQYIQSLSLKEQIDILADRFEWILHEPTMLILDRLLYKDPSRNPYLMGNYAPVPEENEAYKISPG